MNSLIKQFDHSNADTRSAGRTTPGASFDRVKRIVDIAGALVCLIALTPVLVFSCIWILLIDGRPVFYSQWRVGHSGWFFRLHKLRTMKTDAEQDGQARFAQGNDPRILPGCAWMRKSHIDELPQLWNILKGQMSLVGPRPERPEIIETLRQSMPKIERRLLVMPGLTGLAQVRNGYTSNAQGARKKLAYDLRYLRNRNIWQEIKLLISTIPKAWDQTAL